MKRTLITLGNGDAAKISVDEPMKNDDTGKIVICKVTLGAGNKQTSGPSPAPAAAMP